MKEIFKDIPWFEWKYQISNLWNVKSLKFNNSENSKILKIQFNTRWYSRIYLWKWYQIHRLVMFTFKWISSLDVNHKDWNKQNNNIENLEYCTKKENINHGWKNGLYKVKNNKKIIQYSKDWKFIKEWFSARDIERELWIWNQNIPKACKWTIKTLWWFIWKYKI